MREFTILVSDRNRNVRQLLRREMESEGYHVRMAKTAMEVLSCVYGREPIDLVILDPELPDTGETSILEKINDRVPSLPVVVHSFSQVYLDQPAVLSMNKFIEKNGNSIEQLKRVVSDLLKKTKIYHDSTLKNRE